MSSMTKDIAIVAVIAGIGYMILKQIGDMGAGIQKAVGGIVPQLPSFSFQMPNITMPGINIGGSSYSQLERVIDSSGKNIIDLSYIRDREIASGTSPAEATAKAVKEYTAPVAQTAPYTPTGGLASIDQIKQAIGEGQISSITGATYKGGQRFPGDTHYDGYVAPAGKILGGAPPGSAGEKLLEMKVILDKQNEQIAAVQSEIAYQVQKGDIVTGTTGIKSLAYTGNISQVGSGGFEYSWERYSPTKGLIRDSGYMKRTQASSLEQAKAIIEKSYGDIFR